MQCINKEAKNVHFFIDITWGRMRKGIGILLNETTNALKIRA